MTVHSHPSATHPSRFRKIINFFKGRSHTTHDQTQQAQSVTLPPTLPAAQTTTSPPSSPPARPTTLSPLPPQVQPASLDAILIEREKLRSERDALMAERNALAAERDALAAERDKWQTPAAMQRKEEIHQKSEHWADVIVTD